MPSKRTSRRLTRLRRSARRILVTRPLLWVASRVVPILYTSYMGLVWATSRVRIDDTPGALDVLGRYNGALGLFWHE